MTKVAHPHYNPSMPTNNPRLNVTLTPKQLLELRLKQAELRKRTARTVSLSATLLKLAGLDKLK